MTKTKRRKSIHYTLSAVSILLGIAITLPFLLPKNTASKANPPCHSNCKTQKPASQSNQVLGSKTTILDTLAKKLLGGGNSKKQSTSHPKTSPTKQTTPEPTIPPPTPAFSFSVLTVKPSRLGGEPILVYTFTNPDKYSLNTDCSDSPALLWRKSDNMPIYSIYYDSRYGWTMANGRQYYGYVAGDSLPDDTYYVRATCHDLKEYSSPFKVTAGTYPIPSGSPELHTTIVIFDDRSENTQLNGVFQGIDWGTNVWDVDRAVSTSSINSLAFDSPNATTGTFSFTSPQILISMQLYNNSDQTSLLTLSCDSNPTVSGKILPNSASTLTTNWSVPCTTITMTSSNGRDTSINSLIYANTSYASGNNTQSSAAKILGNITQGSLIDQGEKGYMNGSKFTSGTTSNRVTSLSVFVGNIDASPNNKYQLAIYADNHGVPGKLIAHSDTGILRPLSWNTLPITAKLSANTAYWLMYNTNATTSDHNNMYYDTTGVGAWAKQAFGSWPTNFPTTTADSLNFSIHATLQ